MRSGLGETWGRGEAVPERGTLQIRRRLDPEEGKNASEGGEPVRRSGKRSRARFLVVVDQSVRRGEATKMLFSSEREKRATRTQEENNTTTTTPTLRGATNTRAIPTVLLYTDTRREFIRVILRSLSLSPLPTILRPFFCRRILAGCCRRFVCRFTRLGSATTALVCC